MPAENMASGGSNMPACREQDCFALREGRCSILTDNIFPGRRRCPFYKNREVFILENAHMPTDISAGMHAG